jgi:hypothetical protein
MKKLLALLIMAAFALPTFAEDKKPAPKKTEKVQKKHKKAQSSGKVVDDKPTKLAKKK